MVDRQRLVPLVQAVPDWPRPGVSFCDLSALVADGEAFHAAITAIADHHAHGIADAGGGPVTKVLSPEARGFVVGAAVALRLDAGFVAVRRAGRLPAAIEATDYTIDYGNELIEVRNDGIGPNDRVLVVDDVLGTGATAEAVVRIVERLGGHVVGVASIVELTTLGARRRLDPLPVFSVLDLDVPGIVASSRPTDRID